MFKRLFYHLSGQNTPTDSVVSGRSITDGYFRHSKPYLGWRSQENVSSESQRHSGGGGRNTPNERLAHSLRRSQQSGLDRFGNSNFAGNQNFYGSWQGHNRSTRDNAPADWFVHDSIRSVSSAIAEFCKADDVQGLIWFFLNVDCSES